MRKTINRIIGTIVLIGIVLSTSSMAFCTNKISIDEDTFNKLVTRAKEADTLEKEKDFYRDKYEKAVERALELNSLYKEDITLKDRIISSQKELVEINKERMRTKDDIISLQDKKISRLERNNFFKNAITIGLAGVGIALASDKGDSGAAVGIGAASLLSFIIK